MWLPSVITSAPAANSSSACFGVMPTPPAAFSPLTTTKSSAELLAQAGQQVAQRRAGPASHDVADEEDRGQAAKLVTAARRILVVEEREDRARGHRRRRARGRARAGSQLGARCPLGRRSRSRRSCAPPGRCCCCSSSARWSRCCSTRSSTLLRRARLPRGLAVLGVCLGARRRAWSAIGVAARQPDRRPGLGLPRQRPAATSTTPTGRSPTSSGWLDDKGIDVQIADQGQTALETLGDRLTEGSGEHRRLHARRPHHARRGVAGADPRSSCSASTCCSTASGSARRCAGSCRAATARRKTTSRPASSAPCSATSAASCCSR